MRKLVYVITIVLLFTMACYGATISEAGSTAVDAGGNTISGAGNAVVRIVDVTPKLWWDHLVDASTFVLAFFTIVLAGATIYYAIQTWKNLDVSNELKDISARQTEIMAEQKDISREQIELSIKLDESSKFMAMLQEYSALSSTREYFMPTMRSLYSQVKQSMKTRPAPDDLGLLILEDGPPELIPLGVDNLKQYINENRSKWEKLLIWEFVNLVWQGSITRQDNQFNRERLKLAQFWFKWSSLMDVGKYLQSLEIEDGELTMIAWSELVIVQEYGGLVVRMAALFKLAKAEWEYLRKCWGHLLEESSSGPNNSHRDAS